APGIEVPAGRELTGALDEGTSVERREAFGAERTWPALFKRLPPGFGRHKSHHRQRRVVTACFEVSDADGHSELLRVVVGSECRCQYGRRPGGDGRHAGSFDARVTGATLRSP